MRSAQGVRIAAYHERTLSVISLVFLATSMNFIISSWTLDANIQKRVAHFTGIDVLLPDLDEGDTASKTLGIDISN